MKTLVLTDNVIIYEGLKKIFDDYNYDHVDFAHSHIKSDIWSHEDFRGFDKAINVKQDQEFLINNYNLIISGHCKQFFPKKLVNQIRCINIHPGYNPINRGWYPQVFAIVNDLPIGATIHEMDEKLDHGPIITRAMIEKHEEDTSLEIYTRVINEELKLFKENFKEIISNTYKTITIAGENSHFFDKEDFKNLSEIDLDKKVSFREALDFLRAMTHGDYKNAYFIDKKGDKVFVSIKLNKENG
ncbi:hypothetical protein MATR_17820 [Marivirga tractuosa]|uniref:Formyl transferase domain protein n=1 Tax=Marivirga tractuosa (strain ATCC 23168 / DSM 4126 / NBRC 15989 / NCIMB 1408 / VKM B-1430 / H-43) TaxID=643867 RepID=E4TQN2_MARTH|nr:dTDP-4-amino-4,6-dideoxyglucose formyltransferase [Marivirga tractuosa]ADR20593.1 formyl transferase domain protein [Marivirga tractuosa DSM 4126]BDD14957.1 hypothetical protein MATR_17820 [Marivirga tractuosa]